MSNSILEHKLITLNSRYANKLNGTYNSNVLFNFKGILTDEDDIISSNICIMNAQLPVSFYTINETNNFFEINGFAAIIPVGNYNGNTLITAMKSAILSTAGIDLTITLSAVNGRLTFSYGSSFSITMPTNSLIGGVNFTYKILGFDPSSTISGTSILAPYALNLLGINRIAIRSNKLAINSFNSVNLNLGVTLATIPVDVPAFSLISYTNQTDLNKSLLRIKIIDEIDIFFEDEDNNLINFNNIDWTIALVLENIRVMPTKFINSFESLINNNQLVNKEVKEMKDLKKEELKNLEELELLNA